MTMTDRALASAPAAPLICAAPAPASTASTDTPKTISDVGTPTVTSTINVSGAPAVLRDVDLLTNISHTNSGDLRITLSHGDKTVLIKSPSVGSGPVPGGVDAWDNTFAGTLWDDSAGDPASDHLFTGDGAVTPLNPEQPLAAFIGADPNGAWTLTVEDTDTGAGGTLNSWALTIAGLDAVPPLATATTPSTDTPKAVNDLSTTTSTLNVTGASSIWDVNLRTNIDHTASGDLVITLTHGTKTVTIGSGNGGADDNVFGGATGTLWDDSAAVPAILASYSDLVTATPLSPEEALGAFIGMNPNGAWTLSVQDALAGDTGTLKSWSLAIQSTDGCAPPVTPPVTPPSPVTPNPSPVAPGPADGPSGGTAKPGKFTLSAKQLLINQRIGQAAIRRLAAVEAKLDGKPAPTFSKSGGGKVTLTAKQLLINQRIYQAGVRRAATLEARVAGTPAPKFTKGAGGEVQLTVGQLKINQRIAQAAVRRANALQVRVP